MVLAVVVGIGATLFGTLIRPSGEITLTQAASTILAAIAVFGLAVFVPGIAAGLGFCGPPGGGGGAGLSGGGGAGGGGGGGGVGRGAGRGRGRAGGRGARRGWRGGRLVGASRRPQHSPDGWVRPMRRADREVLRAR